MTLHLDKINPKFRELVDLLCFTDRLDLDLFKFKNLLKENYYYHFNYLWDRFSRSLNISWENGSIFWSNRLRFLFFLNDKKISQKIEILLEKRMIEIIETDYDIDPQYNIEYLQFLELCKVKYDLKKNLTSIKNYLSEAVSHIRADKLINIVNSLVPIVFSDINEYTRILTKNIINSTRNYEILLYLETQGYHFDKEPIVELVRELVFEREPKAKNIRAFFILLNDDLVRERIKSRYNQVYHNKLVNFIKYCEFSILEDRHLRNIRNLIDLDSNLTDDLLNVYADKLYARNTKHKYANADRLIRLLKTIPQFSQKKVLVYLSSNNKMSDIKYIVSIFPDLKKLTAFI